jgi:hypothetical protein
VCAGAYSAPYIGGFAAVFDEALGTGVTGVDAFLYCNPGTHTYQYSVNAAVLNNGIPVANYAEAGIAC